jgi:hypothetical protein
LRRVFCCSFFVVDSALDYNLCNFRVKVLTYIEVNRSVKPVSFFGRSWIKLFHKPVTCTMWSCFLSFLLVFEGEALTDIWGWLRSLAFSLSEK